MDADFQAEVLADLYTYRRKRTAVVWGVWLLVGMLGGHRFYLGRPISAVLMLFTGGGLGLWWLVDALLLGAMVREHNVEQARREEEGQPPLELDFMPAIRGDELVGEPEWATRWRARGPGRRALRSLGNLLVLLLAGSALGMLGVAEGTHEAVAAVLVLVGASVVGAGPSSLADLPGVRSMLRWIHRLRLFYWYNEPGSPPTLLLRSVIGLMVAPFQRRARAEVGLYLGLGGAFTIAFLLLEVPGAVAPLLRGEALDVGTLLMGWAEQAALNFVVIYAFAAPVGAVLTLNMLTHDTHRVPRLLGAFTLLAIVLGALSSGWY